MKIPISTLKKIANQYKVGAIIVFCRDDNGRLDHVITYGRTIEESSRAADFGNKLKTLLRWPESLFAQPSRVRRLQKEIIGLKAQLKKEEN